MSGVDTSRKKREKRSAARVAVQLTAHCQLGHQFLRLPVVDLSAGGMQLHTRERAAEGTPVRIALALPSAEGPRFCTFTGHVAHVLKDARGRSRALGVCFVEAEQAEVDQRALVAFLQRSAEEPPTPATG